MFYLFKKKYGLGIDISNHSIEGLSLTPEKDIKGYARVILDDGIIKDGRVRDKAELAEKLREVLENAIPSRHRGSEHRNFSASEYGRAVVSIPEMRVFSHYWKIPQEVDPKNVASFINEEAQKLIPFGENTIYWDTIRVQNGVLYTAAEKDVVDEYNEVMRLAGVENYVFEPSSVSLGRAFLSQERFDELRKNNMVPASVMVMDIGGRTTNISIWNSRNILCLAVTIPIAGDHFTEAIKNKFNISETEAEKLKRTIGFDYKYKSGSDRTVVVMQLQAHLQKILQEVGGALSYYEEEYGEKVVEVLLSGGSSLVPQIDSYISTNLEREVRIADPLPRINSRVGVLEKKDSAIFFSNAIGLALRGITEKEPGLDFSPQHKKLDKGAFSPNGKKFKITRNRLSTIILSTMFLVLCAGAAGGYFLFRDGVMRIPQDTIYLDKTADVSLSTTQLQPAVSSTTSSELLSTEEALSSTTDSDILTSGALDEESEKVTIIDTPTGWLNVREDANISSRQISRVIPGQSFILLEKREGWYKIDLGEGVSGWISSRYAQ